MRPFWHYQLALARQWVPSLAFTLPPRRQPDPRSIAVTLILAGSAYQAGLDQEPRVGMWKMPTYHIGLSPVERPKPSTLKQVSPRDGQQSPTPVDPG
jgi:hypothetical protein